LFYSVLGEKVPTAGYAFFGAVFLSSPLISEVFTYFLHNGIEKSRKQPQPQHSDLFFALYLYNSEDR
jgi:hypothetical protein